MKTKARVSAPCGYRTKSLSGKTEVFYPAVDCAYDCDTCGWNPKEAKRRIRFGHWEIADKRFNPDTGATVVLPDGTMRLVFRRVEK